MSGRNSPVREAIVRLLGPGDRPFGMLTASPEALTELAAGHALAAGLLDPGGPLPGIERGPPGDSGVIVIRIQLPGTPREAAAHPAGCGMGPGTEPADFGHVVGCPPCRRALRAGSASPPIPAAYPDLFRDLYAGATTYRETGGLHAAALSDGSTLLEVVEDVSRHSAVDKTIGGALLAGRALAPLGLILTARISGEIAFKAARAGLSWVASRSVPTTLALEIAAAAGLPLVARAAGAEPRLFGPGGGGIDRG